MIRKKRKNYRRKPVVLVVRKRVLREDLPKECIEIFKHLFRFDAFIIAQKRKLSSTKLIPNIYQNC